MIIKFLSRSFIRYKEILLIKLTKKHFLMFGVDPSNVDPFDVDSCADYSYDDTNDEEAY